MSKPSVKWLTKSLFVHALDCPTKAYYKANPDRVQSTQEENGLLKIIMKIADGDDVSLFVLVNLK